MAEEVTFYSDDRGVRITNTRLIIGAKTYAMANITSVSMGETPPNYVPGTVTAVIGLAIMLVGGGCVRSTGSIVFGAIVLGIGIWIAAIAKPTYTVRIGSASGEVDALSSKDKKHIENVVNAMNEAIVKRG